MYRIKKINLVAFLIIAPILLEFTSGGFTTYKYALFKQFDSTVEGTIIESKVVSGRARWSKIARVCYEYRVGYKAYNSCFIDFSPQGWSVEDKLKTYPKGNVLVFYSSVSPDVSILNPSLLKFLGLVLTHVIGALIFIGLFCIERRDESKC